MPPKTPIGEKIFSLRKSLKLTQGELGQTVGVSRAAISQFELGDTVPSNETMLKISEALNFDLSKLWLSSPDPGEAALSFIELPFFPREQYHFFIKDDYTAIDWKETSGAIEADNRLTVLRLEGVNYDGCFVIEIKGSSMSPRYPDGALYVASIVPWEEMQYATGVHMLILRIGVIFRRITSNNNGIIQLRADATGEEFTLNLSRLGRDSSSTIFKLGQAVHLPPEE